MVSEPRAPRPGDDGHVPDAVLDELSAAFAEPDPAVEYDFDDPSIDRLLGLTPAEPEARHRPEDADDAEPDDDLLDDPEPDEHDESPDVAAEPEPDPAPPAPPRRPRAGRA